VAFFSQRAGVMRLIAITVALLLAIPARAVDRQQIATVNIAATSLFTFLGCVVQGKLQKRVQTGRDAARCLAAGGAAGIGFYQAKRLVADGDITTGWLVANLATSVVENTAAGEHPFGRIGYTFGPFRLRFATPADRARESYVDLDLSVVETGFLARMLIDADDVDVRDGMLWWETDERLTEDGRAFNGYTWGLYPGVWTRAGERTWNHEAVHAVQALQLDSVDPPAFTLSGTLAPCPETTDERPPAGRRGRQHWLPKAERTFLALNAVRARTSAAGHAGPPEAPGGSSLVTEVKAPCSGRNRQPFRIRYIRAGAVNLTDNLFWGQRPYDERWVEIEAYRLVDDRRPPQ
jgi:hypothetical protein